MQPSDVPLLLKFCNKVCGAAVRAPTTLQEDDVLPLVQLIASALALHPSDALADHAVCVAKTLWPRGALHGVAGAFAVLAHGHAAAGAPRASLFLLHADDAAATECLRVGALGELAATSRGAIADAPHPAILVLKTRTGKDARLAAATQRV